MFCQMIQQQWEELKHCQTELLLDNYKIYELKKSLWLILDIFIA